ncbi:hypothetical protein MMC26_006759 [Xylographa opegraphella]|nr:hypothetical protein [Xylographa opegraphella]
MEDDEGVEPPAGAPVADVTPVGGRTLEPTVVVLGWMVVYSVKVSCEFAVLEAVNMPDVEVEIVVGVDEGVIILVFVVTVEGAFGVDDGAAPERSVGILPGPGVAEGSLEKKRGDVSPESWNAEPLADRREISGGKMMGGTLQQYQGPPLPQSVIPAMLLVFVPRSFAFADGQHEENVASELQDTSSLATLPSFKQ